jgi:hypothetical protein
MPGLSSILGSSMLSQLMQLFQASQSNNNDQSDQNQFNDCMQKARHHHKSQQCQQSGG